MLRVCILSLASLFLSLGCSTTGTDTSTIVADNSGKVKRSAFKKYPGQDSPYAAYLAGHYALNTNNWPLAKSFFDTKLSLQDEVSSLFAQRAVQTAMATGDIKRAAKIAKEQYQGGDHSHSLRVIIAADALSKNRRSDPELLPLLEVKQINGLAVAAIGGWNAYLNGKKDLTKEYFENAVVPGQVQWAINLQKAVYYEREKNIVKATLAYKALEAPARHAVQPALALGAFYERQGAHEEAIRVYESFEAKIRAASLIEAALVRAKSELRPPSIPSPRETAALGVIASAYSFIGSLSPQVIARYCALAYHIDNNRHEALVLLGTIAEANDRQTDALYFLSKVPNSSAYSSETTEQIIWIKARSNQLDDAIRMATDYAKAQSTHESYMLLGDLHRRNSSYDEAIRYYNRALPDDSLKQKDSWRILFSRGVTYHLMENWTLAEADLLKALALAPSQPEILNYLGYTWVDKEIDVEKGMQYIEKAVSLRPNSGQIVDSLGWAEYRVGRYRDAVKTLERAVELEPGDPTINSHLGDAYQKVGRRREAVFQWEKALNYSPEKALEDELVDKLNRFANPL